jgi:hypothetical protein
VEKVAAVGTTLDFCDFSTPAGELDMVADFQVGHFWLDLYNPTVFIYLL